MSNKMNFYTITTAGFFVEGIAVETINKDGRAERDISALWTRFMTENIAVQISGKLSDDIYCVYTDYETDHTGWYTAVLGFRIKDIGYAVGDDLFTAFIPPGNYNIYKPQGLFPQSVANIWREIWQAPVERKYIADYDLYKAGAKSFEETEAEVYLAIV